MKTLLILFLIFSADSSYPETAEITGIRELYSKAKALQKSNPDATKVYARFWIEEKNELSDWIILDKNSKTTFDIMTMITLFLDAGKIYSAILEENTPSGDWVHSTEYYFYENQDIAFIYSTLNTFYGNVKVEKRLYFDKNRQKIRELKNLFELQSKKEIKNKNKDHFDREVQIFKNTKEITEKIHYKGLQ